MSFLQKLVDASSKEISRDFLEAIEAISFLDEEGIFDFNESISFKTPIRLEEVSFYYENKDNLTNLKNLVKDKRSKELISIELSQIGEFDTKEYVKAKIEKEKKEKKMIHTRYMESNKYPIWTEVVNRGNFADFLVLKLTENLKRLYSSSKSADKRKSFPIKTEEDLLNQQDNILKVMEFISDKLKLSDKPIVFKSIFFRDDYVCTSTNALFFCLTHNSLSQDNAEKLIGISKKIVNFSENEKDLLFFSDSGLNSILYKDELSNNLKSFMDLMPEGYIEKIVQLKSGRNNFYKGRFQLDLMEYCAQRNISLPDEDKMKMINDVFHAQNNCLYHLNGAQQERFVKNIGNYFHGFNHKDLSMILMNCYAGKNSPMSEIFCQIFKDIKCPNILVQVAKECLTDSIENLPVQKRAALDSITMDEDEVIKACKIMEQSNKKFNNEQMLLNMINISKIPASKRFIANIIAINPDFLSVMKPFYRKIKLDNDLKKSTDDTNGAHDSVKTRIKQKI